jgi:hypothetical protein
MNPDGMVALLNYRVSPSSPLFPIIFLIVCLAGRRMALLVSHYNLTVTDCMLTPLQHISRSGKMA